MGKDGFMSICALGLLTTLVGFIFSSNVFAAEGLCARVKIQIKQDLTLERQAFEAHMRINNGLADIAIEDIVVLVNFLDEDGNSVSATSAPDDTFALFFIRLDSMSGIDDIDGAGQVAPSSSADITWLIIPAPGSSNGTPQGTLYYVGATLIYTLDGEEYVTEVMPDYIYVKPMPEMTLDYFLPTDVYGDDAFTAEVEAEVPFPMGLRVANNGAGTVVNLVINSAQAEIVDNEMGLLIGFRIQETEVNGQGAEPTLKAEFGDIGPNSASVAKWMMTCSLSGEFIDFTADFSHSDELGGELTSLIESVNTHFLVKDVQVDMPGRDEIDDFLAMDGSVYRVYESDNLTTLVADYDEQQAIIESIGRDIYQLTVPVTEGFMTVQLPDPEGGRTEIGNVMRSDGKVIKEANRWLSKTRDDQNNWLYSIHIFDDNTTGSYTIEFGAPESSHTPVLQFVPDRTQVEGSQLAFLVQASDPDGTIPMLSASPLPAGATFTDREDGSAIFDWTPMTGQAGEYPITFTASDGVHEAKRTAKQTILTVAEGVDTDGDGMPDEFELEYFKTLARDGLGDLDGDGFSDLREALAGTNPDDENDTPDPITVFVDDDGNVSPELGTPEAPFNTIAEGVSFAGHGDTIAVASGTYMENLTIQKDLNLSSEDPENTVIDGSDAEEPVVRFVDASAGSMQGFDIRNGFATGIRCTRSTAAISRNRISAITGQENGEGDGILVEDGSSATIANNLILGSQRHGVSISEGCTAQVVNNTVAGSGNTGIHSLAGASVSIANNIVTESGSHGIACMGQEFPEISYNNIWSSAVQDYVNCGAGEGDISVDPMFTDPSAEDFHLKFCSPSIDAGNPASDDSLEPWPNGDRINQGAYGGTSEATLSVLVSADLDGDGDIDGLDLSRVARLMGTANCGGCPEDLDGDGDVDEDDLAAMSCNLGKTGL